jgi:hypothetical protein
VARIKRLSGPQLQRALEFDSGLGDLFTVSAVPAVICQATHIPRSQDITWNSAADVENPPSGRVAFGGPETTTQSFVAEDPHFDSAGHVGRYRDTVSTLSSSALLSAIGSDASAPH